MDIYQQVFSLAMLAYDVTKVKAVGGEDKQERLQHWAAITHAPRLEAALGGGDGGERWETVFGPVVWSEPGSDKADNTWFITRNPNARFEDGTYNTYVLSIAGTVTTYDWLHEDATVQSIVDFPKWMAAGIHSQYEKDPFWDLWPDPKTPFISKGTAQGMYVILNTKAPPKTAASGKNMVDFISTLPSTARFIITGHSLGSALSSGIACALKKCGYLNRFNKALVFGIAGPTPGNRAFAEYFDESFPIITKPTSPTYQVWNSNLWNTRDMVPHAWSMTDEQQNLSGIVNVWPMGTWAWGEVEGTMIAAKSLVEVSRIDYSPVQGTYFNALLPSINPADSLADIKANVTQEHSPAYYTLLGIPIPNVEASIGRRLDEFGLRLKTDEEVLKGEPFLELLLRVGDKQVKAGHVASSDVKSAEEVVS